MLRQTVGHRAPPLPFPSFSPLTVTFPKLAVILRPLEYSTVRVKFASLLRCLKELWNSISEERKSRDQEGQREVKRAKES
jgi:hypothetical protein